MNLIYAVRSTGEVVQSGSARREGGAAVVGLVKPRPIAVELRREAAWGPLWLIVRHDGACKLTVTPILDGEAQTSLAVEHTFTDTGGAPADEVVKVYLSEPVTWPGDGSAFSRQALRSQFFTVQCELEATTEYEADAGNTGDGTITGLSADNGALSGDWILECTAAATDSGTFKLTDPDGTEVTTSITVGTAYDGALNFTITDGATDFAVGDTFTITVNDGEVLALGGLEVEARPLGYLDSAVNAD